MTRVLLLSVLVALPALAGEVFKGIIVSGAGADTTNATTAAPFCINKTAKLTIACTASAFICIGNSTCTASLAGANPGVPVIASEKFPTSANSLNTVVISSQVCGVVRIVGTAAVNCVVWERTGTE